MTTQRRASVRVEDLVGVAEIAARLAVTRAAVSQWRSRSSSKMPAPVTVLEMGPVWSWPEVDAWASATGRGVLVRSGEVLPADMRAGVAYLPAARALVLDELRTAVDAVAPFLRVIRTPARRAARRDASGRLSSLDGRGNGSGEWDSFYSLAVAEQKRLRRWMSSAVTVSAPDQFAAELGRDDIEQVMTEWRRATALADALRSLERGRVPSVDLARELTFDPAALWGPDAADYLARIMREDRERYSEWTSHQHVSELDDEIEAF